MSDLFRKEVLEARRAQWLGTVSLAQPLRLWWLGLLSVLAAGAVVGFLIWGEYTRRTRVVGQLVPDSGLLTLMAPSGGVLSEVAVVEGDRVSAGRRLAQITVPAANSATSNVVEAVGGRVAERAEATRESHVAQLNQLEAREAGLRRQRAAMQAELAAVRAETRVRSEQVALSQASVDRFRQLQGQQYVTAVQVQQQESQWLEQRAMLQALGRSEATLNRQLASVEQEIAEIPAQRQSVLSAQRRDSAAFVQEGLEIAARGDSLLTSPTAGRVTALLGLPGQAVQAGQPLLTVLPDGSALEAHLLVPSNAIGFVAPGDRVKLRYQAFPYQKFGQGEGEVLRVSRSALSSGELAALALGRDGAEPLYRVVVGLKRQSVLAYGKEEPLKPGMLVEADVLGETRKLWEWVMEPLFSVTGRSADN